ncbi:MAG TPA: zinc-dependent peptidase [Accumulibacter sp.]|uniref:M90 family metallopeptidase n=1 Tax=Accumulibacter sp. TaxID=2053492 RepID=UPI002878D393|nr:zinc-dependent peptidase [Accumulibacter sp.]MDS4054481.1 zinc-dependent peptidase [Accumulibacter sp.]HMV04911.1 zinc-dependent peptidase [Accumulibacter sp.]HMW64953.1 zinc-dependent peptidase [Accumulibacter sp.]HMW81074.1 zinc-dependent peptidase [Accumulibacter sp.]HMX67978.1 zinc-dependent peptidase [Accumulibacter sp.]
MIDKLLAWWRNRPLTAPIPDGVWQRVVGSLPFLAALSAEEQARLRRLARDFLSKKEFTPVGGVVLNDEMCVSIAAQGCLPILELGLDYYRGWVGMIVYPDEFVIPRSIEDEFGVVHEYDERASGEAWSGGPLLISWRDAQMAGSGYNVVIHEFAHKLDMLSGEADGVPPLPAGLPRAEWEGVLLAAYEDFAARVEAVRDNVAELPFDAYAAENRGEFFAVMSEAFFETPLVLRAEYPALYAQLTAFYRQNPAARSAAGASGTASDCAYN